MSHDSGSEVLRMSRVVAKSMRRLDKALGKQRAAVVSLAEELTQASVQVVAAARRRTWSNPEIDPPVDDAVFERLARLVRASLAAVDAPVPAPDDLPLPDLEGGPDEDADLVQEAHSAAVMAWHNAVEAQQALHTLAQAALTQGISLLFSVAGDALSEKQELVLDGLTPQPAEGGLEAFDDDPDGEDPDDW
jgi:hypothetical protein